MADSVIAAVGHGDPVGLLMVLPLTTVNRWLQELTPGQDRLAGPRPVDVPRSAADMLLRSADAMGSGDPRVVWLAFFLAVVRALPSN